MKHFMRWLRRPLRNERGEITFFACFFVVGVVMLISFLLLYASVRITCIYGLHQVGMQSSSSLQIARYF